MLRLILSLDYCSLPPSVTVDTPRTLAEPAWYLSYSYSEKYAVEITTTTQRYDRHKAYLTLHLVSLEMLITFK